MSVDEVLEAVDQILQPKQLGSIERFVLRQSWLGQNYSEMAKASGYGSDYIKERGSQLWQDLSEALKERVTKKNLHLVLSQYQQDGIAQHKNQYQQKFTKDTTQADQGLVINTEIDFPGAPVPLDSPLYINRPPIEELVRATIRQPGCLLRIKAPSRTGKS